MKPLPFLCENEMLQHLLQLWHSSSSRIFIALVGLPGAGKSTLAATLQNEMRQRCGEFSMMALGMDGFHLPKAALRQMPDPVAAFARRGAPWTFDPVALATRLHDLRQAFGRHAVPWPVFEHGVGDPVEGAVTVPSAIRLVLVEGLYLALREDDWAQVAEQFDETWFLDTPLETALARLESRHRQAWKMTHEQAAVRINGNDRLNAHLVLATRESADFLLADRPR